MIGSLIFGRPMRRGGLAILLIGMASSGAPGQTEFEAPRSDVIVSEKDEVDLVDDSKSSFRLPMQKIHFITRVHAIQYP